MLQCTMSFICEGVSYRLRHNMKLLTVTPSPVLNNSDNVDKEAQCCSNMMVRIHGRNIFESVMKLDKSVLYVQKDMLMNPRPAAGFHPSNLLQFKAKQEDTNAETFYMCPLRCRFEVTTHPNRKCPHHAHNMSELVDVLSPPVVVTCKKDGYLKKFLLIS